MSLAKYFSCGSKHKLKKSVEKPRVKTAFKMVRSIFEPQPEKSIQKVESQRKKTEPQQQKMPIVAVNANLSFICGLVPMNYASVVKFKQKQQIVLDSNDIWIIVTGELNFSCKNNKQFSMSTGFMFCLSKTLRDRIQKVEALSTHNTLLKIECGYFAQCIMQKLCLKNIEKIKLLKRLPYANKWDDILITELATSMDLVQLAKDEHIYSEGEPVDYIYFVKEGIVVMQRNIPIVNPTLFNYELNFEAITVRQNETKLLVKPYMNFGIDGVFIKQDSNNRIYNAVTACDCDIYRIKASLIEAVQINQESKSSSTDGSLGPIAKRRLSSRELNRICSEFASTAVKPTVVQPRKEVRKIDIKVPTKYVDQYKRKNVLQIKLFESRMRRQAAENITNRYKIIEPTDFKTIGAFTQRCKSSQHFRPPTILRKNTTDRLMTSIINKRKQALLKKEYELYKKEVDQRLMLRGQTKILRIQSQGQPKSRPKLDNPEWFADSKLII